MEKKATRDGFGEGIVYLGETNPQVVVLSADLTESTRAEKFRERFPERFFSCGIAEQNMIGIASGLASGGKIPFACSFGVFSSGRCWDQIRMSVCYSNFNVKIVGSHGGITVGEDGASHQALEEFALLRVLPRIKIVVPCDAIEAKKATIQAAQVFGPLYLRTGREKVPIITKEEDSFVIGKAKIFKEGKDVSIFACGIMVSQALNAQQILAQEGISAEVINIHTLKPLDLETILNSVKKTKAVVTAEEHQLNGGLGSAIAEVLGENFPVPLERIGIKDVFGESGKPLELMEKYGLTHSYIVDAVHKVLKRK